jgi:hypothetical protein
VEDFAWGRERFEELLLITGNIWYAVVVKLIGAYILPMQPFNAQSGGLYGVKENRILQLVKRLKIKIRFDVKYPLLAVAERYKQAIIRLRDYVHG